MNFISISNKIIKNPNFRILLATSVAAIIIVVIVSTLNPKKDTFANTYFYGDESKVRTNEYTAFACKNKKCMKTNNNIDILQRPSYHGNDNFYE